MGSRSVEKCQIVSHDHIATSCYKSSHYKINNAKTSYRVLKTLMICKKVNIIQIFIFGQFFSFVDYNSIPRSCFLSQP